MNFGRHSTKGICDRRCQYNHDFDFFAPRLPQQVFQVRNMLTLDTKFNDTEKLDEQDTMGLSTIVLGLIKSVSENELSPLLGGSKLSETVLRDSAGVHLPKNLGFVVPTSVLEHCCKKVVRLIDVTI
ncbi:hypothetical protein GQX74_009735 [Glossina fuscipes]|nr:hypothetical protein GQX74_009735 [Glossina fuscipes]